MKPERFTELIIPTMVYKVNIYQNQLPRRMFASPTTATWLDFPVQSVR